MALSGTWVFTVVRDDIIREAMLNVGAIGEAEVATAQEVTDCARKLNMMCKQWSGTKDFAPGLKMWQRQRGDLFLSSTQNVYGLGGSVVTTLPTKAQAWAGGVATIAGANYGQQQLTAQTNAGSAVLNFGVGNVGNFTVGDTVVVQVSTGDIFVSTVQSINVGAGTVTMLSVLPAATTAPASSYVWNYTTQAQRPIDIKTMVLRDINANDTPVDPMTLQEYEMLPSKLQPGNLSDPSKAYYEAQFASGTSNTGPGLLYIDCYGEQDVTKHLHIVYLREIMDFNNPGDNPEYPQHWYRALCWGLSREIAGMFDAEWSDDMQKNHSESLAMAREADVETTTLYYQANDAA